MTPSIGCARTSRLSTWLIGWDLMLEFTLGGAALAAIFSGYLQKLLEGTGFELPAVVASSTEGFVNLPALLVTLVLAGATGPATGLPHTSGPRGRNAVGAAPG